MYKLFVFVEFTLLIVGYLMVHMHIFVFAAFNWRAPNWDHGHFVFSFILSIAYVLVFILFWLYAAFRILGD